MIHVDFKDLNDMMDFAKTLAGMLPEKEAPARAVADSRPPVTPPLPQAPASPAQAAAPSPRPPHRFRPPPQHMPWMIWPGRRGR